MRFSACDSSVLPRKHGKTRRENFLKGLPFYAPIFQRKIRFRPLSRVSPGPTHKARPSLAARPASRHGDHDMGRHRARDGARRSGGAFCSPMPAQNTGGGAPKYARGLVPAWPALLACLGTIVRAALAPPARGPMGCSAAPWQPSRPRDPRHAGLIICHGGTPALAVPVARQEAAPAPFFPSTTLGERAHPAHGRVMGEPRHRARVDPSAAEQHPPAG